MKYSEDLKIEILHRLAMGESLKDLADEYDIKPSTIQSWIANEGRKEKAQKLSYQELENQLRITERKLAVSQVLNVNYISRIERLENLVKRMQ